MRFVKIEEYILFNILKTLKNIIYSTNEKLIIVFRLVNLQDFTTYHEHILTASLLLGQISQRIIYFVTYSKDCYLRRVFGDLPGVKRYGRLNSPQTCWIAFVLCKTKRRNLLPATGPWLCMAHLTDCTNCQPNKCIYFI